MDGSAALAELHGRLQDESSQLRIFIEAQFSKQAALLHDVLRFSLPPPLPDQPDRAATNLPPSLRQDLKLPLSSAFARGGAPAQRDVTVTSNLAPAKGDPGDDGLSSDAKVLPAAAHEAGTVEVAMSDKPKLRPGFSTQSSSLEIEERRRITISTVETQGPNPCVAKFATSRAFSNVIMGIILINLVLMGIEVDVTNGLGKQDIPPWFLIANLVIVTVFLVEIVLKIFGLGLRGFFCGSDFRWNRLDFGIVSVSLVEIILELWSTTIGGANASHLRIVRTFRIARALRGIRVVRLFRYVSALRTLMLSIISTAGSLFWTLLLLVLLFYSFAVILTQTVSDFCREQRVDLTGDPNAVPQCSPALAKFWSSVLESMLTLFLSISGGMDWQDALNPLREVSPTAVVCMILFIVVTVFAVLNVVTGVFCTTAIESAQSDKDIAIMKQMHKQRSLVETLRITFSEIDHDNSSRVSLDELKEALSAKKLSHFMESLGISTQDVMTLFLIIDDDNSGWIDLDEFVGGCMQLHGPAKSLQMAQILHELKVTRNGLQGLGDALSAVQTHLAALRN